ncbi:PR-1-like protein [Amniculicola lignicola CBS 123094]|uniref:PR-1-like protein n=1 Tax=Amniculicola lignicola CBS 123094 TaxID=1392246 RepID=A0A6A5W4W4_9PLEO|nr:PR-1-like protein [Amniculicola lignicola CBS 123094]
MYSDTRVFVVTCFESTLYQSIYQMSRIHLQSSMLSHPHPRIVPTLSLFSLLLLLTTQFSALAYADDSDADPNASVEYISDKAFKFAALSVTNQYRRQHNASDVVWNGTLAKIASEWSEDCVFEHSGGPTGENLAAGYPNTSASIIAWGHERVDYDFKKGEFGHDTGHFTQLVWKSTTSIGCGRTYCNNKDKKGAYGWYLVCEYWPHGNVIGQFKENVQKEVDEDEPDPTPAVTGTVEVIVPSSTSTGVAGPTETGESCPQGAICSAAGKVKGSVVCLSLANCICIESS